MNISSVTKRLATKSTLLGFIPLCIVLTSCASTKPQVQDFNRLADPAVTVVPITPAEPAHVTSVDETPVPVYKDAQIRKVQMDAYVNERGEAFPPSYKYIIERPGGWNMDALREPQKSYVPPQNSVQIQTAPGTSYTPYTQNATDQDGLGAPNHLLYDLKDVKVTGYTQLGQEQDARSLAAATAPNDVVIFDPHLGWVLVPKAAVDKANGVVPAAPDLPKPEFDTAPLSGTNAKVNITPASDLMTPSLPTPATTTTPAPHPTTPAPAPTTTQPAGNLDGSPALD